MDTNKRLIAIVVVAAMAFVAYKALRPSDEDRIARRLTTLMNLVSKSKQESVVSVATKVTDSIKYFHPPVQLGFKGAGKMERTISEASLERIKQNISTLKFRHAWVTFKLQDLQTTVNRPEADSTLQVRMEFEQSGGQPVYDLYDLEIKWVLVEGEWKIQALQAEHSEN